MSVSQMRHGGDLGEATRLFGEPEAGWLDLSTGINPRPYPIADLLPQISAGLSRLPTLAQVEALLAAARAAYQVPDDIAIAVAPGTEILIRLLPFLIEGEAGIVRTSYGSYADAWRDAERPLRVLDGIDQLTAMSTDPSPGAVIVVNPNNPDGRVIPPPTILDALSRDFVQAIVIDEAYADAEPTVSMIPHLRPADPILVLRSFGKFYGLPGLRLGFVIGPGAQVARFAARLGDWPVSTAAATIGARALADKAWQRKTRHLLANRATVLDAALFRGGVKVAGGTLHFRLAETPDAPGLHEKLARAGIWTRVFSDWPGVIRFGVPADEPAAYRLIHALSKR